MVSGVSAILCTVGGVVGAGSTAGTAVACTFWLALLLPAHLLSMRSRSYRMSDAAMRAEWLSRVNSDIHAVVVTVGFAYAIFPCAASWPTQEAWADARCLFRALLRVGIGYFCADGLIVMSYFSTISNPVGTLAHHAVSLAGITYVLRKDLPLTYVWCGGMFLTEASTPFVNQRWFMAIRHRHEKKYVATGLLMTISFLAARPVGMPAFVAWMFSRRSLFTPLSTPVRNEIMLAGVVLSGSLFLLNVWWSILMLRGAYQVLAQATMSNGIVTEANGDSLKHESPRLVKQE